MLTSLVSADKFPESPELVKILKSIVDLMEQVTIDLFLIKLTPSWYFLFLITENLYFLFLVEYTLFKKLKIKSY